MHAKNTWTWMLAAMPLALAACGTGEAVPETQQDTETAASAVSSGKLPKEVRELRRERIRAHFRAKQAKLNVVATTRTDSGQIIDWVPRGKNLRKPPPAPVQARPAGARAVDMPLSEPPPDVDLPVKTEVQSQPWARGPEGTVPVVRFDVERYLAEVGDDVPESPEDMLHKLPPPAPASNNRYYGVWQRFGGPWFGSAGRINIWDTVGPVVGETSIGQVAVIRGNPMQAIEAGKIELRGLNGDDAPHFFVYYRTNGGGSGDWVGGYNTLVDGWQQVSASVSPGMSLVGWNSVTGGAQYSLDIEVRLFEGNWWVWAAGQWAGYYPRCRFNEASPTCATQGFLFSTNGIRDQADRLDWYGEVFDASAPASTFTDMGSGRFAATGWAQAAYFRNVTYYWEPSTYWWWDNSTAPSATDTNCYTVSSAFFSQDPNYMNWFYWGGPGRDNATCR